MVTKARVAQDAAAREKQHTQLVTFLNKEIWPRIVICFSKDRNQEHLLPPQHDIVMTAKEIAAIYGRPCLHILELVFMRWVRGGRNLQGKTFKTRWKMNPVAAEVLAEWVMQQNAAGRMYTAKECLKHLKEENLERLYGFRELQDGHYLPRMPVTAEERQALLEQSQRSVRKAWAEDKLKTNQPRSKEELEQVSAQRH